MKEKRNRMRRVFMFMMSCILAVGMMPAAAFPETGRLSPVLPAAAAELDTADDSAGQNTDAANTGEQSPEDAVPAEATYAPGEVIVMFRAGVIQDNKASLDTAQDLDNVDENFGEAMDATGEAGEAAKDAKSEAEILRDILGDDFVILDSIAFDDELTVALVSSDSYDTVEMIKKLSADDRIASAEANYYKEPQSYDYTYSLNDPMNAYNFQANTPLAHNESGVDVSGRGTGAKIPLSTNAGSVHLTEEEKEKEVVVAVMDSGILAEHEDLKNMLWENPGNIGLEGEHGYNFYNNNTDLTPTIYHGTHVSGIIAAEADNGTGIAGVTAASGANVKIMMLSTDSAGRQYDRQASYKELGAFHYILKAKQRGVNIVASSNSWGASGGLSTIYDEILDRLGEEGIVNFFAAGNHWTDLDNNGSDAPSGGDSMYKVSVGAAEVSGEPSVFSNYGKRSVDVFAPGENILSTVSYKCYFPNIFTPQKRNDTTEYYGLFDGSTVIDTGSDGKSRVTPSKGDTNETVKSFGASVFHAQPDPGSSFEPEGTATYELSVSKDRSFTDSDHPGSLELTIHQAQRGEEYFFYFPFEKNPLTTSDNTGFSIYVMNSLEEGDAEYSLSGGEVLVDADGNCELYNYGDGPQDAITGHSYSTDAHMCVKGSSLPIVIGADELRASGRSVGIGIRLSPTGRNAPGDIHVYLDSIAVSRPDSEIPEGSKITPETSYDICSGTSMACPACAGAYAVYAACHPREDGETGSEYALRSRAGFLSLVTRTDELKDKCSTGGFIDLTHMDEGNPVITDAVCDLEKNTLTIYGERLADGYTLRYKKLEDESASEITLPSGGMDVRFSEDGKTAVITNAKELFGTYIEFLLYDSSSVRASNSFFLVKGQKQLEEVYREVSDFGAEENPVIIYTRKLLTDTKGQVLYGFEPETGVAYKHDGHQFNRLIDTDLMDAARSFMMQEKGLNQYDAAHNLSVSLKRLNDPIYTGDKLYHFVDIVYTQGSDTLEDGEKQFHLLASLDYTADRPAWSFTEIDDPESVFEEAVSSKRYAAMNGKIYCTGAKGGADNPRASAVYSYDIASGKWSREADMPANLEEHIFTVKNDKLYTMLGADYTDGSARKVMSHKAYSYNGSAWAVLHDIPFTGKHDADDHMSDISSSAEAVCAPVKNGFIFFNCTADGFGNTFLYDPDTGEGKPLYYTFNDFKADMLDRTSAVETKDGVYYLLQSVNYQKAYLLLYFLPKSSNEYESSYEDDPVPPEPTPPDEPDEPVTPPEPEKIVIPTLSAKAARLKAGDALSLYVTGGTVKKWSSSAKKVASVTKGKVKALKEGKAVITATLDSGETLTCSVKVTTSPKLKQKAITVKKGETKKVRILGRAPGVGNAYKNTKKAKVVTKEKVTSNIYVKGLKKGKTTLKIRVNGVWLNLKVTVK